MILVVKLTIAIAKGRLQTESLELLSRAGLSISEEMLSSRRLAVEDQSGGYRFIFVKPADVPVYVGMELPTAELSVAMC